MRPLSPLVAPYIAPSRPSLASLRLATAPSSTMPWYRSAPTRRLGQRAVSAHAGQHARLQLRHVGHHEHAEPSSATAAGLHLGRAPTARPRRWRPTARSPTPPGLGTTSRNRPVAHPRCPARPSRWPAEQPRRAGPGTRSSGRRRPGCSSCAQRPRPGVAHRHARRPARRGQQRRPASRGSAPGAPNAVADLPRQAVRATAGRAPRRRASDPSSSCEQPRVDVGAPRQPGERHRPRPPARPPHSAASSRPRRPVPSDDAATAARLPGVLGDRPAAARSGSSTGNSAGVGRRSPGSQPRPSRSDVVSRQQLPGPRTASPTRQDRVTRAAGRCTAADHAPRPSSS